MRNNYSKLYLPVYLSFLLILVFSVDSVAQETPQDTTATGYVLGDISLPDPESIVFKYEYDPILNRYFYNESLGEINLGLPLVLTPQEFEELVLQEEMRNYFKLKNDALSGRKEGSEDIQKDLLPDFYVNSNFFETIFGGSEINILPQGSVELDLGLLYTKQDNPAFSPRNRRNLSFDFDQRISLSLLGQVGERLQITANYDTESTFDFQNQLKLEYTPNEDDIVQKIEVGNVNMPLSNALIQGAQSLFGFKTELQFGKTRVTGVFSEQQSERRTVNVEGGATVEDFEKFALDYDQDRHFFLAHYFRDTYDRALENYPFINTNIQIKRIEVWVTNRTNNIQNIQNTRNIVAIQDLGETNVPGNIGLDTPPAGFFNEPPGAFPDNLNNDFNPLGITGPTQSILNQSIRDIATVDRGFGSVTVSEGIDYAILENARQLNPSEYTLNTQLGYISLNQRLSNDEVLGVAFQFTINGEVYQVGEFANDGVNANNSQPAENPDTGVNTRASQNLVVKMLKSTIINVNEPVWDLMMKNIYSLGAYQLERQDFRMNILYTDPQPLNYIQPVEGTTLPDDVADTPLLRVFNLDQLNVNGDPINGGDGFFDYVPQLTIDPQNGNIIFTTVEPFGSHLFNKLDPTPNSGPENYSIPETWNENQRRYVFRSMYRTTKIQAEQEEADKNKFQLKGRYKSAEIEGIPIGFNLPPGSVTVTAGGRILQEGVDYVVNYELGRVQILDEALLASDIPIQVNTENNALFGQQTKRFTGINVEHQFNENFLLGGTFINLKERPLTQKANYGYEPINNTILGLNFNYSTEVPFLTRLVNKLPNIDTDVKSNVSVRGEFAYLIPGTPDSDDFNGRATTYIDDFEAAQTTIDINNPLSWELSSVPIGFGGELANGDLAAGYKRAKMAWYTIDPIFYSNNRPAGISDSDISTYAARRVALSEIFPNIDVVQGQSQVVYTMDVSYNPAERGPYNYNPNALGGNNLPNPQDNFGGIMRSINTTNFEQSNVEYIQFWVMDPYIYPENSGRAGGTINFNLGNISEDVLKDGRKQYENGLPEGEGDANTLTTSYGQVPADNSLVYAFDTEGAARQLQDAGFDGLLDAEEAAKFSSFAALPDPSADNYQYFLNTDGSIVERYQNYNGTQGNSPTEVTDTNRGNSTLPTTEDINRDNTMNTINSYFEYEIPFFQGMNIDNNRYITDVKELTTTLRNGQELPVRWLQFKIPIFEPTNAVGGIADFRSIRFIRMFLTDFQDPTILRFGTMDLVRGDYRRYTQSLFEDRNQVENPNTLFEVNAVNIEENENRQPVPYVLPPGVQREELFQSNSNIRQNEQSLSLRVCELEPQDARAVYKNFQIDMRQYKNLEMFLHAESFINKPPLKDGQLVAFVRIGTDFSDNFYQVEIPLSPTLFGATSPEDIWPEINRLDLELDLLQRIKTAVLGDPSLISTELNFFTEDLQPIDAEATYDMGQLRLGVKGNPSFGNVRLLMVGVKNGTRVDGVTELCGEVWFNELRLSGLKNEGGWAGVLSMDTNLADFANISATGRQSTIGFGSIEQGPNQRSLEDLQQYDVVTNVNMGQLLPQTWGVKIPVNYSRGEELITPKFDQEFLDIDLDTRLESIEDPQERETIEKQSQSYTRRESINVIGLRKERVGEKTPMPYDIENFAFSTSYNQIDHRDFEIEESLDQSVRVGGTYEFNFPDKTLEPLKNIAVLDSSDYFALFKDFNFNYLPSNINASSNIFRQYNEQKFRSLDLSENDIGIPTLYQRNYLFDWQYGINYNLTRSLNFSFNASNNRIIRNYIDEEGFADNSIGLWDDFFNVGDPNLHFQTLQVNYQLPFSKIPVLKFINATYSYTGDFQWQRGSRVFQQLEGIPAIGNSVQNSNTHQINASLNMQDLYNYAGLVEKKATNKGKSIQERSRGVPTLGPPDAKEEDQEEQPKPKRYQAYNTFINVVTGLKTFQVNYRNSRGIFLPGYTQGIGFMGTFKPTTGFTFGFQDDIRHMAAERGWLTLFQNFNQQYTAIKNEQLDYQAGLDILPDMTIELTGRRNFAENYSENYKVEPVTLEYQSLTPYTYGNFNISTILLRTAFNNSTEVSSETFETFRENRLEVARRIAEQRGLDPTDVDEEGFPRGIGKTNQAVLLPAFIAAYSGKDAGKVKLGAFRDFPIPNWNVKYTGLMRLGWFREKFRRFSVLHGYRSDYTLNQFQTNLDYNPSDPEELNQAGDFKNPVLFSNLVLTELFTPLARIDFETKGNIQILAEIAKDRSLAFSFDNNLLTEYSGNEYTLGTGYRIKDFKIATAIGGRRRVLSSDLNFRADVSYRKNRTIVRYLDLANAQTISGQDIWSINFNADYAFTRNLTARFYYDHTFSEYAVSTAFPQTTIRSGFTLIYNFGN
ncbi:cell surface protein SprA [Christiangramia sabulilitoris]|uniref:Cell surface protein SprA n=1 Tax=Christiangramia sabulilitoris TaxID=2583991 RepID=A0A550HZW4_9FLAO|nr:cell surface protein SprA [Christiangramia sabulilitoris]TRO64230.1 cell surface protein SprA [Christiangramia sabulilitoris]